MLLKILFEIIKLLILKKRMFVMEYYLRFLARRFDIMINLYCGWSPASLVTSVLAGQVLIPTFVDHGSRGQGRLSLRLYMIDFIQMLLVVIFLIFKFIHSAHF